MKPTLIIMAAGMGSRYGGLKQIDPIGPNGEIILDYSVYDAMLNGFGKIVFVIKPEMKELFEDIYGKRLRTNIPIDYAFQTLTTNLPKNYVLNPERTKPWGTGHAVLCCKDLVDTPFAVINADDFYGRQSYQLLSEFLQNVSLNTQPQHYAMAGFVLENTLTENGFVSRGVCTLENGYLSKIVERTKISKKGEDTVYTKDGQTFVTIPKGSIVSMNCWGFTPQFFKELETRFFEFLENTKDKSETAEIYLPVVVDQLLSDGLADVRVMVTKDKWFGVTYKEDKEKVVNAINSLIKDGTYPEKL